MNVYQLSINRLRFCFREFQHVYVSFSGGKDSGVLLNLALQVLDEFPGRKLGVLHLDYEAQYQMTTDYVDEVFATRDDRLEFYRCCVPFCVPCTTSMRQSFWTPWNPDERDIWVRPMPKDAITTLPYFKKGMWDYDFQARFAQWYQQEHGGGSVCCLVGIRTQESLNRWRTIWSEDDRRRHYKGKAWTTDMGGGVVNAYPVFDWQTEDIWAANARFGWTYNHLYDIFYQAGVSIDKMRVASPFLGEGQDSLKLYRVIEPNTWGKMLGRVNGVNFTGIYGGTTAMGWKSITLPKGHTWESYMYFLLDTLPREAKANYLSKLETSMKFWRERGGCMSAETIQRLRDSGVKIEVAESTNYRTDKLPVRMEYIDDIDIPEFREIPTFKRMCVCIMKNDHLCKYMGFSQTKNELERRKAIMQKYQSLL